MSRALVPVPTNRCVVVIFVEDERSGSGGSIWITFEPIGEGMCRVANITHNIAALKHQWEGAQVASSDPEVDRFIGELDSQLDELISRAAEECYWEWDGTRPSPVYKNISGFLFTF